MTEDEFREVEEKVDDRVPIVWGRFNYVPVGKDLFNVIFMSEVGVACVIAQHIPEYDFTKELVDDLNSALYRIRRNLATHYELGTVPKPWPIPRVSDLEKDTDRRGAD